MGRWNERWQRKWTTTILLTASVAVLALLTCTGCVSLNVAGNTGEGSIEKATDTKRTVEIGRRNTEIPP